MWLPRAWPTSRLQWGAPGSSAGHPAGVIQQSASVASGVDEQHVTVYQQLRLQNNADPPYCVNGSTMGWQTVTSPDPLSNNSKALVFCREDGSPVRPDHVSLFLALSEEAGLPRIVLHGLRHTHATHALAAGVSITVAANRLGHSSSSFTADTVTRVFPQVDQEAADLIAGMVKLAGETTTVSAPP
jgi:Phage integrase family